MILVFLDIALQHLQLGMAQPAECPWKFGVVVIITFSVDSCGSLHSLSLALTSVLPMDLFFFRLRQGLGMESSSVVVGFKIDCICPTSMSGVYCSTRKVSYGQGAFFVILMKLCL